ncbi:RNA metabolism protein [Lithospermum erythrorhizon]|uniref:RNA metabolism protein n=1 Tax=Lithospermum erythrorhizon TaxID=34254 RepID=A0AAV3QZZ9_LITER
MTEKRKAREREGHTQLKKKRISVKKHNSIKGEGGKNRGPGLPNQLRKEINFLDETQHSFNDDDVNFDDDVYEYEEEDAIEDLKKNHQFDPVDNLEYELPGDFKDENVASDEDDEVNSDQDDLEEGNRRHVRMLEDITGLPSDAFEGKKKKDIVVSEPYPESEFNPSRDILDGDGLISMDDLMDPLSRKAGFSKISKRLKELEKKGKAVHAPLPKPVQKRLERQAAYNESKKVLTQWESLIKRNREAPTIYFGEDVNLGYSTVGAIAADFEPRTDFEKNIASLLNDTNVVEAHRKDGASLLELNKITVEDVRDRNSHLAKMRSLLFRHEIKAKRIKKIKSKTYRKLQKKDRLKAVSKAVETDPEVAKELAMKQERKRAEVSSECFQNFI